MIQDTEGVVYRCACCGCNINDDEDCPIVMRITVGHVGGGDFVNVEKLPAWIQALLMLDVPKATICMGCSKEKVSAAPHFVDDVVATAAEQDRRRGGGRYRDVHPRDVEEVMAKGRRDRDALREKLNAAHEERVTPGNAPAAVN